MILHSPRNRLRHYLYYQAFGFQQSAMGRFIYLTFMCISLVFVLNTQELYEQNAVLILIPFLIFLRRY